MTVMLVRRLVRKLSEAEEAGGGIARGIDLRYWNCCSE